MKRLTAKPPFQNVTFIVKQEFANLKPQCFTNFVCEICRKRTPEAGYLLPVIFFAYSRMLSQNSGGISRAAAMPRLRVDSSASARTSVNIRAMRSFSLRWTYISPSPSSNHARETLNLSQISEIVRSVNGFLPEHRADMCGCVKCNVSANSVCVRC